MNPIRSRTNCSLSDFTDLTNTFFEIRKQEVLVVSVDGRILYCNAPNGFWKAASKLPRLNDLENGELLNKINSIRARCAELKLPMSFVNGMGKVEGLPHFSSKGDLMYLILIYHAFEVTSQTNVDQKLLSEISSAIAHNIRGPWANLQMIHSQLNSTKSYDVNAPALLELQGQTLKRMEDSLSDLMITLHSKMIPEEPNSVLDLRKVTHEILATFPENEAKISKAVKVQYHITTVNYPKSFLVNIIKSFLHLGLRATHEDSLPAVNVKYWANAIGVHIDFECYNGEVDFFEENERIFKFGYLLDSVSGKKSIAMYLTKIQIQQTGGNIQVFRKEARGSAIQVYLGPMSGLGYE